MEPELGIVPCNVRKREREIMKTMSVDPVSQEPEGDPVRAEADHGPGTSDTGPQTTRHSTNSGTGRAAAASVMSSADQHAPSPASTLHLEDLVGVGREAALVQGEGTLRRFWPLACTFGKCSILHSLKHS